MMLREGGSGSGFFGHSGRPGKQGGSLGGRISKFVKGMFGGEKRPTKRALTVRQKSAGRKTIPASDRPDSKVLKASAIPIVGYAQKKYGLTLKASVPKKGYLVLGGKAKTYDREKLINMSSDIVAFARSKHPNAWVTSTRAKGAVVVFVDYSVRKYPRTQQEAYQMSKFVKAHRNLSEAKKRGNISALETHWKKRLGSDLKKGQFTMLRKSLSNKPGIESPERLAAWWHKKELGVTPSEKYSKMGWRRKKRGKKSAPWSSQS